MRWITPMVLLAVASCVRSGQLRGRVLDCNTQLPVDDADVQMASKSTGTNWDAVKTAAGGQFAFAVPQGTSVVPLTVTAAKEGYRDGQKTFPTMPDSAVV